MTAGSYGYGSMRATDADRENVRQILLDARAEGRLSWDEFDSRTTALLNAQTYGQLAELTTDLPNRIVGTPLQAYQPPQFGAQRSTNGMAIAALICGVCQIFLWFLWFLAAVPAVVFGHLARRRIRQTGEAGGGMALAGMILGYIGLAALVVIIIVIAAVASSHSPSTGPVPGP